MLFKTISPACGSGWLGGRRYCRNCVKRATRGRPGSGFRRAVDTGVPTPDARTPLDYGKGGSLARPESTTPTARELWMGEVQSRPLSGLGNEARVIWLDRLERLGRVGRLGWPPSARPVRRGFPFPNCYSHESTAPGYRPARPHALPELFPMPPPGDRSGSGHDAEKATALGSCAQSCRAIVGRRDRARAGGTSPVGGRGRGRRGNTAFPGKCRTPPSGGGRGASAGDGEGICAAFVPRSRPSGDDYCLLRPPRPRRRGAAVVDIPRQEAAGRG